MKRFALLPVAALCALAAYIGLAARAPDMSDAIASVADRYAANVPGGRPEDCAARPGEGRVWLVVACGRDVRTVYRVARDGRILGHSEGI